jgi:hypothetical protein
MTLAYIVTMKAIGLSSDEPPDSVTAARLIVDLANQSERDPDRLCNAVLMLLMVKQQAKMKIALLLTAALTWALMQILLLLDLLNRKTRMHIDVKMLRSV